MTIEDLIRELENGNDAAKYTFALNNPSEYLRNIRLSAGIQLKSISDLTGVSSTNIGKFECGEVARLGAQKALKVLYIYRVLALL